MKPKKSITDKKLKHQKRANRTVPGGKMVGIALQRSNSNSENNPAKTTLRSPTSKAGKSRYDP